MVMTTSTQMLFIALLGAAVPVESKSILQHGTCDAEVSSGLLWSEVLEESQCHATLTAPGQKQVNSTTVSSKTLKILTASSKIPKGHKLDEISKKSILKIQKGHSSMINSTTAPASVKSQIKLQKMRPQRRQIKVSKVKQAASLDLLAELKKTFRPGADHSRVALWEEAVKPLYMSLPKNEHGNLGHAAARYVLHRAFVRRHSWSIKGLEPQDLSTSSNDALQEWVPEYLLSTIEQLLDTQGIDLQELGVLAATFEDMAHKEELKRLAEVYEEMKLPVQGSIKKAIADEVISLYMTGYISTTETIKDVKRMELTLDAETQKWLHGVQSKVVGSHMRLGGASGTKDLDFKTTARIVEEVGERYGDFNDFECSALKKTLIKLEDEAKPGMVRLSDFYKSNQTYWNFKEKIGYLRDLGALDESSSGPHVIIPNYVAGENNCLHRSGLYNVCCRSECESLMEKLEDKFQAPTAQPDEVAELIAELPSGTVNAPRTLSRTLLNLLEGIAAINDGVVPLHSREFAQWMHHAFPRECPVPHNSGKNPETPDEWLRESEEKEKDNTNRVPKSRRLAVRSPPKKAQKLATCKLSQDGTAGCSHLKNPQQPATSIWLSGQPESPAEFRAKLSLATSPAPWLPEQPVQPVLVAEDESANLVSKPRRLSVRSPPKKVRKLTTCKLSQKGAAACSPAKKSQQPAMSSPRAAKLSLATSPAPWVTEQPQQSELAAQPDDALQQEASGTTIKPASKLRLPKAQPNFNSAEKPIDAEMFLETYNEPAQSYWDQEDKKKQQLDKEALPPIPTVEPTPVAPMESTVHHSEMTFLGKKDSTVQHSGVSMAEAVATSLRQNAALVVLGILLSLAVARESFSKAGNHKMKVDDAEAPSYDMNLVRLAAAASVRQRATHDSHMV